MQLPAAQLHISFTAYIKTICSKPLENTHVAGKKELTLTILRINQGSATDTVFGKLDSAEMGGKEGGVSLFSSTPLLQLHCCQK